MSTLAVTPATSAQLIQFPPRIIRTEAQNESYLKALYELEERHETWTPEEAELADLLTLLIEDYEGKHYQLPKSSPLSMLRFLMEEHGLKQKDLVDLFGTPSIVSEVLNGKRELSKEHIRRLSAYFHLSPELFF